MLFLEKYEHLLRLSGLLGVIISNTWMQSITYAKIRQYLSNNYCWQRILHIPEKVFRAVVDTHVLIFNKNRSVPNWKVVVDIYKNGRFSLWHETTMASIPKDGSFINIVASDKEHQLFEKIKNRSSALKEHFKVFNGVKPFEKGKGNPPQTLETMRDKPFVKEGQRPGSDWKPLLRGSLIH